MMHLDEFEQELFASSFEGERWMYMPRVEGERYGLAIAVVGRRGKVEIPLDLCNAEQFDDIRAHSESLNRDKIQRAAEAA